MANILELQCNTIEQREGYQAVYFYTVSNDPNVETGNIVSIACGMDRTFEEGKHYGLDLQEIKS